MSTLNLSQGMGKSIKDIMEKLQLKATARDLKTAKLGQLRREGGLPAVLYGHKVQNQPLTLNASEFEKVFKKAGESTIIDLITEDGKKHPVLIHDIQNHFLNSQPIHVDFYEVSMTEKLKAKVVLEYMGESKAVKELGGVLVKNLNEIEIECLPADLPHNILVDISVLKTFQDSILVRSIKLSEKIHILTNPEEVIAKVQPPRNIEAELEPTVAEADKVAEVIAASTEKKEEAEEETNKDK